MPWNNGVFERYNGEFAGNAVWQNDRDADYEIEANRHDAHDQDLAQGINACLPRDGSAPMVADLDMGGFRLNNLAPAQLEDEIALFGQTIQGVSYENFVLTLSREGMPDFVVDLTASDSANAGSRVISLGTVADMQAADWLQVGQRVKTAGYYIAGDGGGSEYEIVAGTTGTDDGGSFIDLPGSGLQAKGVFRGTVSVKQFGVDTTGSGDATLQLAAIRDAGLQAIVPSEATVKFNAAQIGDTSFLYGSGVLLDTNTNDVVALDLKVGDRLSHHNSTGKLSLSGGAVLDLNDTGMPGYQQSLVGPYGYDLLQQEGGWLFMEPARRGNPSFVEMRGNQVRGKFTTVAGQDRLTYQAGDGIAQYIRGLPLVVTYQDREPDVVRLVNFDASNAQLVVEALDGNPHSFAISETVYVYSNFVINHCLAEVGGNTVRFLKDPSYETPQFVFSGYAINNEHVYILIGDVPYLVTGVESNPDPLQYHQVLTVSGSPPQGVTPATQAHFWDGITNLRLKAVSGGGEENGLDLGFDVRGYYRATTKGKSDALNRALLIGTKDGGNSAFFRAGSAAFQSVHFSDSNDFWGFINPELANALNAQDDFKVTVRRDGTVADQEGGTERIGYARFWGRQGGGSGTARGVAIESINDLTGAANVQGFASGDSANSLSVNGRGGAVLIRTREAAPTAGDTFIEGSTTLQNSGGDCFLRIVNASGGASGGRVIGDSANRLSLRAGLSGDNNSVTISDADNTVRVRVGGGESFRVDGAPGSLHTAAWLLVNNGTSTEMKRVEVGAVDSGGVGYRALRVTN